MIPQKTIRRPVHAIGIGVHSGKKVRMTLRPAGENAGIVFVRTDVAGRGGALEEGIEKEEVEDYDADDDDAQGGETNPSHRSAIRLYVFGKFCKVRLLLLGYRLRDAAGTLACRFEHGVEELPLLRQVYASEDLFLELSLRKLFAKQFRYAVSHSVTRMLRRLRGNGGVPGRTSTRVESV